MFGAFCYSTYIIDKYINYLYNCMYFKKRIFVMISVKNCFQQPKHINRNEASLSDINYV